MADSLLKRFTRVANFVRETGIIGDTSLAAVPGLGPFVARNGLNVRTIHHVHAAIHPDRVAAVDERQMMTYAQMNAWLNRLPRAFSKIEITRGDRVILCMENRVEYLLFWFAGFRAGVAMVHASYRSTADELRYLVAHSRARAIVCSERTADAVREIVGGFPNLSVIVVDDVRVTPEQFRFPAWARPMDDAFFAVDRGTRGANVVYTSGTTGKPKGAVRNFSDMGIVELSRIGERLPLRTGDRHLVVAPLYHSGAQAFVALMTSLGASIHLRPHFDAADTLHYLSRWHIESIFMVPTMIRRILDLPVDAHEFPTPHLRILISGAAVFPQALRERAVRRFGQHVVFDFYGATEMGWVTLIDGREMLQRPGSVGRVLPGQQVRILDSNGLEVGPGEVGTIWVRNEQLMEGYLDDEEATASSRDRGWATVDDLGSVDEDGYLYLAGRDRDMVISGGVNIYPVEIEQVIASHPAVVETAVIGLPDEEWGEQLAAVVVGKVSEAALDEWARQRIASHKVPRQWFFAEELPRNPTGKVLKRALRERHTSD